MYRKEKPNVALFYLKNALEIEINDPLTEELNLSGTHLNLCAIYSKLNKHQSAVYHAKKAIKLIEKLIIEKERESLF
jgi:tetratricopeptide (TPR) repeat protein